ncbi:MAG TPA: ABC transporter substrate-binding protein [Solirubrobacterales bacterium]
MRKLRKVLLLGSAVGIAAVGLAACGGGGGGGGGTQGGTATVVIGTAPDYLDPQEEYTTQGAEADWISYTPLVTYKHENAPTGNDVIPGLATALPTISADGKTYTMTLRKGLVFSDGTPIKASDFACTAERMIKVNWGGKSFFTDNVSGATAFDKGQSDHITGITTDDATGKITIQLDKPYGAFTNVLAFPELGLVPCGTPEHTLTTDMPPSSGPYMLTDIVPNKSYSVVKNPKWAALNVPDIPVGHLDRIDVTIESNTQTEAQKVLNNQADNFDAGDTLPPSIVPQVRSQASDRFEAVTIPSTFYFFMNVTLPPFNNELARQAVNVAIDRPALQRLASGFLEPGCFFLPEGIPGHPTSDCPYGPADGHGDIAKAQQLVQQSGTAGQSITVWGEQRAPRTQYVEYYADLLNKIGYKATPKLISDTTYFPTIGNAKTMPQTGFADWIQDFPNPVDFYLLLATSSIQPVNNENFGNVSDPFIDQQIAKLEPTPSAKLDSVASQWQAVDEYTAKKAYVVVYGSEQVPKFFSDRIDFDSAVVHPTYLNDWSTWQLK